MKSLRLHLPKTISKCENDCIDLWIEKKDGESTDAIDLFIYDYMHTFKKWKRSNKFLKNLVDTKAFQDEAHCIKSIISNQLSLDDWEPLLQLMRQSGASIKKLQFEMCHLTKQGALLLGKMLKSCSLPSSDKTAGIFCVKELHMYKTRGSTAWIEGFLQNKTITHLHLLYSAPLLPFIQKLPHLIRAKFWELAGEEETVDIDVGMINQSVDLESLEIRFGKREQPLSSGLCRSIGSTLDRAKNLKYVELENFKGGSQDFLKNATHANKLELFDSDFDSLGVASLVRGGKLKTLHIDRPNDMKSVELLLQLADLSFLDCCSFPCDGASMDALCRQLGNNKGPKRLKISVTYLREAAEALSSCLAGNNRIETLEVHAKEFPGYNSGPLRQFVDAMGKMPNLRSWTCELLGGGGYGELFNEAFKKCVLHQVRTNRNIQHVSIPRLLGNAITEELIYNRWPSLFYCRHSCGVWSFALSRIKTVGLMFQILSEFPSLVCLQAETNAPPSFVVPHHPDCPACQKKRKHHVITQSCMTE